MQYRRITLTDLCTTRWTMQKYESSLGRAVSSQWGWETSSVKWCQLLIFYLLFPSGA